MLLLEKMVQLILKFIRFCLKFHIHMARMQRLTKLKLLLVPLGQPKEIQNILIVIFLRCNITNSLFAKARFRNYTR